MRLIQPLFDGSLDIIGDVHGELEALLELLATLGYDKYGNHPNNRKIIFVGDLVDRGPDSVGVIKLVRDMIALSNAQCILGNHELNILNGDKREGNGWFFGYPHEDESKPFNYTFATDAERKEILLFFKTLPIALVSDRLRIVHACWDQSAIDALEDTTGDIVSIYNEYEVLTRQYRKANDLYSGYNADQAEYGEAIKDASKPVPFLLNTALYNMSAKRFNHIKTITSGPEEIIDTPYYAGGKWRMVDRCAWWDNYNDDIPVIIGHYWRELKDVDGIFNGIKPRDWFGKNENVFCVDYSIGRRYRDRAKKRPFTSDLMALRYPENILVGANSLSVINNGPK